MEKYNKTKTTKLSDIVTLISKTFKIKKERTESNNHTYFDTYDWRLYKSGLFLTKSNFCYTLAKISNGEPLTSIKIRLKKKLSFWQDFPDGKLKNEIKNLIGVRSLIKLISVSHKNQIFTVLNNDEKIVVRLTFQEIKRTNTRRVISLIYLNPVRGYNKEFERVKNMLTETGSTPERKDILAISLPSDIKPGSYTGKLNIKLQSEMTTRQAVIAIFSKLLDTIKQNEEGIRKNIDTEFLHDFRVAVRRTRSLFSQVRSTFPVDVTNKAKRDFSTLGKMTNKLRDLDVYILKRQQYIQMLPGNLRSGIEPIFNRLEIERKEEQKKLALYLNSQLYKNIITSWNNFLENQNLKHVRTSNSDIPIIVTAKNFILKKFKKIIKTGKLINDKTPDPEIHSLRIECKKLRYLLEFFSSLFPNKETTLMINYLKKLQDTLGDFNDLHVQQENLRFFLRKIENNKGKNTETMALGGLITILYQQQQEVRKQLNKKIAEFSKAKNIKLYDSIFS